MISPHLFQIVAMKDGRIHVQGTLSDIKDQDPDLYASWNMAVKQTKYEMFYFTFCICFIFTLYR